MKTNIRPLLQLMVIYVATTLFLVALSVYTFVQIRNLIASSDSLNHTHKVRQSLQKILTTLTEAETYKRGFLLTGDSAFLQKKDFAMHGLTNQQLASDSLMQGNTDQVDNLAQLQRIIRKKTEILSDIPSGRKALQVQYEIKTNTREGAQMMDSLKAQIEKMIGVVLLWQVTLNHRYYRRFGGNHHMKKTPQSLYRSQNGGSRVQNLVSMRQSQLF